MSDEPSPPVKRSAVTYGRRKAPEFDEFENLLADTSITSMHSVFAASSESGMDLPPSSDDFDMSFRSSTRPEEDEDESEDPDEISSNLPRISRLDGDRGYEFEWKKKLREIDGDAEEELIGGATHKDTHPHKGVVLDREAEDMATNLQQAPDEGPPNSSFPILTGSSVQSSPVRSPSPSISRVKTRRRVVVQDSDSESEAILPGSPASGHLITTPPSGSSSTPPTSQEMVPVTDNKKGKQKAHAIRRRVSTQLSSDEEGPSVVKSKINKKGKTGKQRFTKKEIQETTKTTARMIAQQPTHIPRAPTIGRSLSSMFSMLREQASGALPSDPIQQFSSPDPLPRPPTSSVVRGLRPFQLTKPEMETENFRSNGLLGVASAPTVVPDSDDEMTDERGPRASMQRAQDLAELKRRAIEQQAMHYLDDNDDSDLEIVEDENISPLRHGKKKQYVYVKPNLSKTQRLPSASVRGKRRTLDERSSSQLIAEAAVPLFVGSSKNKGKGADIDQSSLNRILAQRMSTQGQESVRRKEAEWTKRGGRLADMPEGKDHRKRMQDRILALSEQALRKAEGNLSEEQADELDEESDEEWRPEDSHDLQHSDVENETSKEDDDTGFVVHRASDHTSEEETEEENLNPRSRYPRPRHTAVLDSDEENGPPIQRTGRVLVPDSSFTQGPSGSPRIDRTETASLDGTIENETDKENDASMVFDRGEDKENAAIGSPALLSRDRSFKRTSSFALGLQLAEDTTLTGDGQDASASQSKREPFKEISRDEDDLFMSDPVALQRSPPRGSPRLSSPSLSPLQFQKGLEGGPGEFEGFSEDTPMSDAQNDDGEVLSLEPALAISPGLSRLFESSAAKAAASPMVQTALKTGGFSQFFTPNKAVRGLDGLRKSNVISLTFDGTAQPSLGISGTLFRKAEDIFGKEQEFVVEEANRKPGEKQQLFVNEHGFLTQTRPSESFSECHSVVSSVKTNRIGMSSPFSPTFTHTGPRRPLDTLVLEDDTESPTVHRTGRLRKRSATPEQREYESSPTPSPTKPKDAFNVLMKPRVKPVKRLEKSEFVEGEAEESDEERKFGFGFGGPSKGDEDESDGEDQDQTLAELVDDQQMDQATLNEAKVIEKVKEHQQIDDAELERLHRDAAEGKLRAKRRDRGIGFEDSDSEDDDGENARRRQKLANKKRRIDGDTLDEIAKDPETRPFVEAYNAGLNDDDHDEFAHLARDDETFISTLGNHEVDGDDDNDEDEDDAPGMVSVEELRQRARQVARGEETISVIDPNNVSYVDLDDGDEEEYRVKEVATGAGKRRAQQPQTEWGDDIQASRSQASVYHRNMETWARHERTSRSIGTGRASGSSVTGLTKSKLGGGSLTGQRGSSSSSNRTGDRKPGKLAKAPSVLSAVSSRRERFV